LSQTIWPALRHEPNAHKPAGFARGATKARSSRPHLLDQFGSEQRSGFELKAAAQFEAHHVANGEK